MKVKINQGTEIIKIVIEGNLESTTIKPFNDKIANIPGLAKNVEVDLEQVGYIDSSGIRAILTLSNKLKDSNKNLSIINCSDNIKRILKFSSLQGI
jgi:anti-anti-sigma factor